MIWLAIATVVQFIVLIGLTIVVLSLARQIGVLHERLSPAALSRNQQQLKIGEHLPFLELPTLGDTQVTFGPLPDERLAAADIEPQGWVAMLFIAADCPICRSVLPAYSEALSSLPADTRGYWVGDGIQVDAYQAYADSHVIDVENFIVSQELGLLLGIRALPALVLVDPKGHLAAIELIDGPKQLRKIFASHLPA